MKDWPCSRSRNEHSVGGLQDPDAHRARAEAVGAEITREPVTQDHGGRDYTCKDIQGHVWTFGTCDPWAAQQA
jgi:uncharacterized glyoxalase superfamily protein PhnB